MCKNDCRQGFVELVEDNWETIGIIEKYGYQLFMNINGESINVSTSSIKDVLQAEGLNNKNYSFLFNNIVIVISTAINTIQFNNKQ